MSAKKIIIKILPWAVVALVVYFFSKSLSKNYHNLGDIDVSFNIFAAVGILLFTLAVITSGILWSKLLSRLVDKKISLKDGIRVHSASWVLKYVPGQVGSLINKLTWGAKNDISKKTITTSFLYENVLTVFASIVLSIPVVWIFKDVLGDGLSMMIPLAVVIPLFVILYKPLFYKLLNLGMSILKRKPFKSSDFLPTKDILLYTIGYLIPRVLNGIGFVFIASSFLDIQPYMYLGLGATFILASVVGLLAVFVPGGIGVREAVIVLFASMYMPVEQAIVLSLLARVYAIFADVGVAIVYIIFNKGRIKQS